MKDRTLPGVDATAPVVVFDLDETLTFEDTSLRFLRTVAGSGQVRSALVRVGLGALHALAVAMVSERRDGASGLGSVWGRWEGLLHERVVSRLLAGRGRSDVEAAGEAFAVEVMAGHLRPDARQRLEDHRASGHALVLASASLEVYVEPLSRLMGFHACVGTRLEAAGDAFTGRFLGLPCWGNEKLRRVREVLGPDRQVLFAYGDSRGDEALLAAAQHGVRLGSRVPAGRLGRHQGDP